MKYPHEHLLSHDEAQTLALTRQSGGINRYEAETHGQLSLTQRVWDLKGRGYRFMTQKERYTDTAGRTHNGVARYLCVGWSDPQASLNDAIDAHIMGVVDEEARA